MNVQSNPTNHLGKHAIVIGASMAGLVAGRVLTDYFEKVTIIERDELPADPHYRIGVPQGRHPHVLLKRGELILEELFPGLRQELLNREASILNTGRDVHWFCSNHWRPRYESSLNVIGCSRPLLETTVRHRLATNSQIQFRTGWEVCGLQTDPAQQKATGVRLRLREQLKMEVSLAADLIVDASGRSSRAPTWLEELGYTPPRQTVIDAAPSYATRIYRRPTKVKDGWKLLYVQPTPPYAKRGAICTPIEGERWHVTLIGMDGECPPTREEGFLEYAHSLPVPDIYEIICDSEPLSTIIGYRHGANQYRHYDQMEQWLGNFVALGDAVVSFNPVYGQGMSVAAMSGKQLAECLQTQSASGTGLTGLAEAFQKNLVAVLKLPWQIAIGEDLLWPNTSGAETLQETDPMAALMQNYLGQVVYATTQNPTVTEAFYQVVHLMETPELFFRPDIVLQVVTLNNSFHPSQTTLVA